MVGFMASRAGRWTRVIAGAVLILLGALVGSFPGLLLALFGMLPFFAGAADLCPLAPLLGHSVRGDEFRRELGHPPEAPLFRERRATA